MSAEIIPLRNYRPIVSRFERFFFEYEEFLEQRAENLALLMREDVPSLFASDVCNPVAEQRWLEWLAIVESDAPFSQKHECYLELKKTIAGDI